MADAVTPLLGAPPLVRYGMPSLEYRPNPAVATAFTEAIDGLYFARLISVFCRLVTDANAADRLVLIEYRDSNGARFAMGGAELTQAASLTRDWAFNAFQPGGASNVDATFLAPLPPILLLPEMDFRIFVDNMQAGDQLSQIRFYWERFYTSEQPSPLVPS